METYRNSPVETKRPTKWYQNILCWFGRHDWSEPEYDYRLYFDGLPMPPIIKTTCLNCKKYEEENTGIVKGYQ